VIIVSKAKIRFLNAGRVLTIEDTTGRFKRGRSYAAGHTHRRSVCRVEIVDITADHIHIRLEPMPPAIYLAANPGSLRDDYTDNPALAARDPDGPIEATDIAWLSNMAKHAADRDDVLRREQAHQTRQSRWRTLPSEAA
jgi:hypothetical protein